MNIGKPHADVATPISHLLVTYALLPPILFLAAHSAFSFDHGERGLARRAAGGMQDAGYLIGLSTARGSHVAQVEIALALSMMILAMVPLLPSIWRRCRQMKALFSLPILALCSTAWSQYPTQSIHFGIFLVINTLFAFYLVERFAPQRLMQLMIFGGTLAAFISLFLVVSLPKYGVVGIGRVGTWQGMFVTENSCAMAMLFFLTPALFVQVHSRLQGSFRFGYICAVLLIIGMTRSRTAWIYTGAFLVAVYSLKLLGTLELSQARGIVALIVLSGLLLLPVALFYLPELSALLGRDATLTGRTDIWKAAVASMMKRWILGYGYSAFWNGMNGESARIVFATGWNVPYAHNGYLDVCLQLGLMGFGLLAATLLKAGGDCLQCLRYYCSKDVGWYMSVISLTIAYNLVEGTFLAYNYLPWIMFIVACVGIADHAKRARSRMLQSGSTA
jgi:exopolysaccharide production protein ExoQ